MHRCDPAYGKHVCSSPHVHLVLLGES
jgi:hypothetical protein